VGPGFDPAAALYWLATHTLDSSTSLQNRLLEADLLRAVFGPRFFDALPLHIRRDVLASALQRLDVIDDITRAGARGASRGRAESGPLEFVPRRCASPDAPVGRALAGRL
jgi:hypothetical protein